MNNVIDLVDQIFFRLPQQAGVAQMVWVYDRPVDIDGLRRFHHHLQQGRLSRLIERSPLPFGRPRWVLPGDQPALEIVAVPRPRDEFDAWLDELADAPLDAEHGPGWRLAMLPFTDGGAGVSLVISHCITDGVGGTLAVMEAAFGHDHEFDLPAAGSRGRWRALREDARQTLRDMPDIRRAAVAAARFARRNRVGARATSPSRPQQPAPAAGPDEVVTLPTATIFLDADEWDARARSTGGTSNALFAAFAARLAQRVGRVGVDGSVNLAIPVNERTADDTRANAVTMLDITVDPRPATTDLREIRASIKDVLSRHQREPDDRSVMLPLVPLVPQRLAKRMIGVATGGSTNVVVASNVGVAPPVVRQADGTNADHVAARLLYPRLTRAMLDQMGGLLCLYSARVDRQVFVSVIAYQPVRSNSNDQLQSDISSVLRDFSLNTATIGWPGLERVSAARASSP